MKDTLSKFMGESAKRHEENSNLIKEIRTSTNAAIRNQGASIKTLEIHIGQMIKITLRVEEEKIVFTSVISTSSLIKRVYMLSLRERMELDLEVRLMGETLVINRSLDPFLEDYMNVNDLNEPFELRRNQGDDLMPTIEECECSLIFKLELVPSWLINYDLEPLSLDLELREIINLSSPLDHLCNTLPSYDLVDSKNLLDKVSSYTCLFSLLEHLKADNTVRVN
ncbi:hypothetical protein Tco_0542554 [Tanacetum coccineum]